MAISARMKSGDTSDSGTSMRSSVESVEAGASEASKIIVDWAVSPMWRMAVSPGRSRVRSCHHHTPEPADTAAARTAAFHNAGSARDRNGTVRLEREVQGSSRSTEGELLVGAEREAHRAEILERMEVADVAADTDVRRDRDVKPAADIPAEIVVIGRQDARRREVDVRLDESDSGREVRANRPDLRREHHVAHDGDHARLQRGGGAEEVARVGEFLFKPEDAPRRPQGDAEIHPLVLA